MVAKRVILFWVCVSLLASCKKEKDAPVLLYPVEITTDKVLFANETPDTAHLEFALIRIANPHTIAGNRLNDGFAIDTGTLPVVLLPNQITELEKWRFVYRNLDTLRNDDALKSMSYNVRTFTKDTVRGTVESFSKTF